MARPTIRAFSGQLFRKQIDAALDYLEANSGGTPSWDDVTDKPTTFPPESHSHVIGDTTGLQAALDGKQAAGSYAAASHTHALSALTQSGATTNQVPQWNGSAWVPATAGGLSDAPSDGTQYARQDGAWTAVAGDPYPWTVVNLDSDFTISTTAAGNVTGFLFTPEINKKYLIETYFILQAVATTTGPRPGWTWPSNLTEGVGWIQSPNSATASAQAWVSAASGEAVCNATGLAVANRSYMGIGQAILICGASTSGNFQIRLRSEVAASGVTMKAGSFLRIREF